MYRPKWYAVTLICCCRFTRKSAMIFLYLPTEGTKTSSPFVKTLRVELRWVGDTPPVLWRYWLGGRKGIRTIKNWLVGCWRGCLEWGADLHMAQLMPLQLTLTDSCFSKIQIGFTFLVPAYPGSPRQRAAKWACVLGTHNLVKSRLVLLFWYRLTLVVLDKGPLNECVCVCVSYTGYRFQA